MRTLHKYIASSFLVTFVSTLVVFTFVLCIGIVFKVTDLLARGVAWESILRILLWGVPQALSFSIPVSTLVASLLVFGRMSADGEVMAMKACGIGLWRIVFTPIAISVLLVALCVYINNRLVPRSHLVRRQEIARLGVETPLELLDEGRFIEEFPGLTIYIGKKQEKTLQDVRIYDLRRKDVKREIRAATGALRVGNDGKDIIFDLQDVRVDPFSDQRAGPAFCQRWIVRIDNAMKSRRYRVKEDDMTFTELLGGIRDVASLYPALKGQDLLERRMMLSVEVSKRLVLSVSCFAFVMLGIPLGIKAHRKESSIGVGISLILVFNFYIFIVVAESLNKHYALRPDMIAWLPVVISVCLGSYLIKRQD